MSHFHAEIWVEEKPVDEFCLETIINDAMGTVLGTDQWDYYLIGGRWTGNHDGYDPTEDPRNYGVCNFCKDGKREEVKNNIPIRGCNVCHGTGAMLKHSFVPHENNVMAVKDIKESLHCFNLIVMGDHQEVFTEEPLMVKKFLKDELKITRGYLITVDYHN